ncbi:Glucose-repressible gene protein [Rhodotorula toruloides]|nr:Glucose-repressible gene protein [Rhodotorula toruloides]
MLRAAFCHDANYVSETAKEWTSGASKEGNKEVAKGNTDASLTDRASAGLSAVGDKMQEEKHRLRIRSVNYVTETAKEWTAGSSKEANKEVAKGHTDASLTDRASAGLDAVSDKLQEEKHSGQAEAYKKSAQH